MKIFIDTANIDEIGTQKFTLYDTGNFASSGIGCRGNQRVGLRGIPLKWDVERESR